MESLISFNRYTGLHKIYTTMSENCHIDCIAHGIVERIKFLERNIRIHKESEHLTIFGYAYDEIMSDISYMDSSKKEQEFFLNKYHLDFASFKISVKTCLNEIKNNILQK